MHIHGRASPAEGEGRRPSRQHRLLLLFRVWAPWRCGGVIQASRIAPVSSSQPGEDPALRSIIRRLCFSGRKRKVQERVFKNTRDTPGSPNVTCKSWSVTSACDVPGAMVN